jgi:chromatin segregation and condensation protein Rec8/ScpA/Scc1 (kleisin family)
MKAEGDEDEVDEVLEAIEEHGVVKSLLAQLAKMRSEDETFDAKVTVLIGASSPVKPAKSAKPAKRAASR